MFDIGFWELTVLAVIGLIVLGPERLPVVARTLGLWVGRAKGYVRGITSELEREVQADELRSEVRRTREQIEKQTRSAMPPLPPETPGVLADTDDDAPTSRAEAEQRLASSPAPSAAAADEKPAESGADEASASEPAPAERSPSAQRQDADRE